MNLRDFLILFTCVPVKFIDKYYSFYDKCKHEKYGIVLEDVLEYLNISGRKNFYERFVLTYRMLII